MIGATIDDPIGYFEPLGGLHDADILLIAWNPKDKTISISVDDIYSNSLGYQDYPGPEPALIIFSGVV